VTIRLVARAILAALSLMAAVGLWLAAASACWSKGTGEPFALFGWWDALAWWGANWWCNLWIVLAAVLPSVVAVFLLFGLFLWLRWRMRTARRLVAPRGGDLAPVQRGVTDNLGHARWATQKEIAAVFSGPGCLIGAMDRSHRSSLLFDNTRVGPTHSMIFAGPGSDKTTSAVTRIWTWRGPRVVFDPSCEIGPIMTDGLTAAGCDVVCLGLDGGGINALDWIDIAHPEADAHIRSAVDWIYNEGVAHRSNEGQAKDPFWGTWGRALVTCLAAHMLYSDDATLPKTMATLRQGIATPENQMQTLLAGIFQTSNSRMARDLAGGLMGMRAADTFSGIYSNAFSATEWLSVGAYADIVSGGTMATSRILDPDTVVFVQLPLRTLLATPSVGRAVMGALFNAMFHADGRGVEGRILFQIDEAWTLGALKEIKLCQTTARKYSGTICTIWQSEGQMEGVWGRDDAKLMRDTLSWRSYNAIQDGDIAEKLSRDLGEHGVLAISEGDNQGRQKPFGLNFGSISRGINVNTHEIKRRLIKADEIMRAPADQMFVLARDFPQPIRCNSAPYYRYPSIAEHMADNRFVKAS
jgi:type IV secretion system protein VirD4